MFEPRMFYDSGIHQPPLPQIDEPPIDYTDDDDDDDDDGGSGDDDDDDGVTDAATDPDRYNSEDYDHYHHHLNYGAPNYDLNGVFETKLFATRKHQHATTSKMPVFSFDCLQFEKLIGQGGFGRVHLGRLITYDRECFLRTTTTVAIKEPIYYDQQSVPATNRSIIKEARLHYQLEHSNIIELYGVSRNEQTIYLIMEYASGGSLRELLTKRILSPNIIIKFAMQISNAMHYLHNFRPKPIIHRDLKSLNILLNKPADDLNWPGGAQDFQIKLTDLGLAREFSRSTIMTQCGTYAWMAPESITKSKFSKSSDVWSFGVVLWELLTGQLPYKNVSGAAVAFGIGNRKLTLPIPETCPEELRRILEECWHQDPDLRPSFEKIRQDLEQSSFNVIKMEQFQQMKQNWFDEIETKLNDLKLKEEELKNREQLARIKERLAKRKEQEIVHKELILAKETEKLKQREMEVVGRELKVLLQQQHNHREPEMGNRKTKKQHLPKRRRPLANSTMTGGGHQPPPLIGYPQNFRHNLTITTRDTIEPSLFPSLQAKAVNRTWTSGTRIRPELYADLFCASRSSSISQDLGSGDLAANDEQLPEPPEAEKESSIKSKKKKKKLGHVLKKLFNKSSRSNLAIFGPKSSASHSSSNWDHDHDDEPLQFWKINNDHHNDDHHNDPDENELYSKLAPKLNRTYHGQTKHSERQRIEHYRFQEIGYSGQETDDSDDFDGYHENVTTTTTRMLDQNFQTSTMTTPDDDLQSELDRFEQEFQSMKVIK